MLADEPLSTHTLVLFIITMTSHVQPPILFVPIHRNFVLLRYSFKSVTSIGNNRGSSGDGDGTRNATKIRVVTDRKSQRSSNFDSLKRKNNNIYCLCNIPSVWWNTTADYVIRCSVPQTRYSFEMRGKNLSSVFVVFSQTKYTHQIFCVFDLKLEVWILSFDGWNFFKHNEYIQHTLCLKWKWILSIDLIWISIEISI